MTFNPEKHHRQSIRIRGYDYTQASAYFVTLCTHQRRCLFGQIVDGAMYLNCSGQFIQTCWKNLPNHFPFIELDVFVVMPNHIHGIIIITEKTISSSVGAKHSCPDISNARESLSKNASPCPALPKGTKSGSLGAIVQNFKSVSTRKINRINSTLGETIWQRNYHEHIIRDQSSLHHIRQYITNNPQSWTEDPENQQN
jgi:REP element-mobilizing transposase RayT